MYTWVDRWLAIPLRTIEIEQEQADKDKDEYND